MRPEGLSLVEKALKRQTFRDFEWLVGSPYKPVGSYWVQDDFKGGFWTLNRIYNKLIQEAKADLIVSWQDYTFADPDTLEKFYFHFTQEPKTLVSGIGNKYQDDTWREIVWKDPRERADMGTYYPCIFADIEFNLCSIPKEALSKIGGFIEDMDFLGYGMDGYSVVERLNEMGGWDFKLNQTIKSYSLPHPRLPDWDKNNLLRRWDKVKDHLKKEGRWIGFDYLENKCKIDVL